MNPKLLDKLVEISFALKGKHQTGRTFHVSALIDKNRVLSLGFNNFLKTHPRTLKLPYFNKRGERYAVKIHSELACLIKFGQEDCSGLTMVNLRINLNDKLDNSKPCFGCQALLRQVGIKTAYHTTIAGHFEQYQIDT